MKTSLSFLLSTLISFTLIAQKAPIKWGKIDPADLAMTSYEADPDAEAVVLAEYGRLAFDLSSGDFEYEMKTHIRIKILKKSAFERGDISIPYYSFQKNEKIYNLKAQVILPNGKKISVDKKDFFEEKINKYWSQRKFAFPNLQEGCIIEYQYIKQSKLIYYLSNWYFQSDIPTRLSEFRTDIPEWFNYVSFNQGLSVEREVTQKTQKLKVPRQKESLSRGITQSTGNGASRKTKLNDLYIDANVIKTRYYLKNIPALKAERFITTMNDYYSKISLQLQSVQLPYSPLQDVTTTWKNEADELIKDDRFGHQINKKRHTKKLMTAVKPLLANADNDQAKVAIIYSFISQNVVWNDIYGFYSNSLDDAFEKKAAKSGELNLMLIALCKQLNIKAYPVLISTRDHGKMMEYYPKTDQFNHVLAYVEIEGKPYLFDIGSPSRAPHLLRNVSLNYKGWLVDIERHQWIAIPSPSDKEVLMATLNLETDGNLSGEVNQSFNGYCAMNARTAYHLNKDEDHKDVKEKWQEAFPDVEINSINFENEDEVAETLKCKIDLSIPQAAQVSGDFLYLSPMLGMGYDENPLKQETRTFSVDIPVKTKNQYILNLTIPDGYIIDELPEAINLKMDGNGGQFRFSVSQNGNKIQVISKVVLSKVHFEPEEYPMIKGFFDVIVEKHGEQIVLKKNA